MGYTLAEVGDTAHSQDVNQATSQRSSTALKPTAMGFLGPQRQASTQTLYIRGSFSFGQDRLPLFIKSQGLSEDGPGREPQHHEHLSSSGCCQFIAELLLANSGVIFGKTKIKHFLPLTYRTCLGCRRVHSCPSSEQAWRLTRVRAGPSGGAASPDAQPAPSL